MSAPAATPELSWRGDLVRLGAVLSGAAAAVHLSVARLHFDEHWLFGVGFVLMGIAQIGWAVLVWRRREDARLLVAGLVLQLGIVAVWVVSRTVGLPYGPHAGQAEAIGPLDAQTTADQLIIAGLLVVALRSGPERRRFAIDALEALALLATAATWFLLATGAEHGH